MLAEPVDNPGSQDAYDVLRALLKQQRRAGDMPQAELASKLGSRQSFVSKYETGERRLDVVELRRICLALGTDLPTFIASYEQELKKVQPRRRRAGRPTG